MFFQVVMGAAHQVPFPRRFEHGNIVLIITESIGIPDGNPKIRTDGDKGIPFAGRTDIEELLACGCNMVGIIPFLSTLQKDILLVFDGRHR